MTQDEIIRMAREAGLIQYVQVEKTCVSNALERFAALVAAHEREKQAEQIPVGYIYNDITHDRMPVYAAPVRTKDLTDDEIDRVACNVSHKEFARAVIAADREKNNV